MIPFSPTFLRLCVIGMAVLLLGVIGFGCGKKGPPLPPIQATIAAPSNLALVVDGNMAALTWLHTKKPGAPEAAGFEIDLATMEDDCEGCPLRFIPLTRVGARIFEYTVEIEPGARHYFRIRAYTETGVLSDSSNTVHVAPAQ